MKIVLITGASSGIGKEFAIQLDNILSDQTEFWLIARDKSRLNLVAKQLKHKSRIFIMDITNSNNLTLLEERLIQQRARIEILINSAGFGTMGSFMVQPFQNAHDMISLNCNALTEMTYRMIPYMLKNARIIQLASSAAFLPQADFAVYAATKSFVLSFSKALNSELKEKDIYVTAVCPGPVDTAFFDKAEIYGNTLSIKKYALVKPERVVKLALKDSYYKKSMSICSMPIKVLFLLSKLIPHDFILYVMRLMKKKGL